MMNRKQQPQRGWLTQVRPDEPLIAPPSREESQDESGSWKTQAEEHGKSARKAQVRAGRRSNQVRVGSRLVESFSEFLSSRNVMIDKYPTYDKLANRCRPISYCSWPDEGKSTRNTCTCPLVSGSMSRRFNSSRVGQLLSALFSSRRSGAKLSLLVSLFRAPVVLAALFSLVLVASLMVFYGLSFARHLQSEGWQMLRSSPSHLHAQVNSHRISSRQVEDAFSRALTVQTECGIYVGSPDEGAAIRFRGIRYASAPTGPRRWQKPNPVWQDPELCKPKVIWPELEKTPHCAQLSPITPGQFSGSEDCLFLDIYTPKLGDQIKLLPVMFYIHGGFLAFGSASAHDQVNWLRAGPSGRLASELNVVIVALNYRLQALGFMAREGQDNNDDNAPRHGSTVAANFGLWDQLAGLNWVRRNIEQFAGDPHNIVLFGPDSGGALALALVSRRQMATGSASGLEMDQVFRGAWLTNPAVYYQLPVDLARLHYKRIFGHSLTETCNNPGSAQTRGQSECLARASAEQVIRQYLGSDDAGYRLDDQNSMPIHGIFADQFVVTDGELVQSTFPFEPFEPSNSIEPERANTTNGVSNYTWPPEEATNEAMFAGKQMLLGSSAQAVEYWPCPRMLNQWSWSDFRRYVATSLNSFNTDTYRRASQLYKLDAGQAKPEASKPSQAARLAYLSMVSDIRLTCPTNQLAESLSRRHNQVHRYMVESRPTGRRAAGSEQQLEFAHHMWDLFAFFGFHLDPSFEPSQSDLNFQLNLRSLIRRFVHQTGNATALTERNPRQGRRTSPEVILFAQDGSMRDQPAGYKDTECAMWLKHLGPSYAWVS